MHSTQTPPVTRPAAARPAPTPRALPAPVIEESTAFYLFKERRTLEARARASALKAALAYYEVTPETLKEVVFANWLNEHAFTERFTPLEFIAA